MWCYRESKILLIIFISLSTAAQSRLVIKDDAYLVIRNSGYVVIENSNANAITESGSGGNILTEAEGNVIRWKIGTVSSGTYTIPFSKTGPSNKIPLSVTINSGGTGSGLIDFSTYGSSGGLPWVNSAHLPSDVTLMSAYGSDNSTKVIDRFWIINASGYSTKPSVTLSFTYIESEATQTDNTIVEDNLQAQRFNSTLSSWSDFGPAGTINTGSNTVSAVSVSAANFFKSWTLVDNTTPLPVELLYFNGECETNYAKINWTTASETNCDYFVIEKSDDLKSFNIVDKVKGAGFSNKKINYSIVDSSFSNSKTAYYRLSQYDFNGEFVTYKPIIVDCSKGNKEKFNVTYKQNGQLTMTVELSEPQEFRLQLFDITGKMVYNELKYFRKGYNDVELPLLSLVKGIYIVNLFNEKHIHMNKININ